MKTHKISSPKSAARIPEPSEAIQEEIRLRAYELYEERGRAEGHDLDDWLAAESEVIRKIKEPAA